jgi:thiol-disulfide isomerase/thioredoxin
MKTWTGRILLIFAIFTLGFGLGKEAGLRRASANPDTSPAASNGDNADKVVVYYLHTTFRCATCNEIERLAKKVVEEEFAEEQANGKVEWRTANFQEQEDLATHYGTAASTVVVANIENGQETEFKRLDDVWTYYDQPEAFAEYVGGAIREFLGATQ